ncbi:MAG: fibronectin type III domain-containing protein [Saprospiraceae bacterium]|nr:fibronectin type III domain-containing protein [Saprospiraceae bacterium]
MKNLIFTILVITCCYQIGFSQCGPTSNLDHQFLNGIHTFSWDPVTNASQYDLYIQEGGYGWEYIATTTSNSFQTPGGVLSSSYEFYVETTCQNGGIHPSAVFPFTIPCPEPTNPITSNISQSGATLNWTNYYANDQNYLAGVSLAYRPLGSSVWISLNVNPLSFSYTMANLQPNTTYEWCVNLDCPYFDSNPVISQFTTLQVACSPPSAPTLFAFTNNSLQVQWLSPQTNAYVLQYKNVTASSWTTVQTNSNTMYAINGLSSGTSYHIRVARVCTANSVSQYSAISTFTTNCISLNNSSAHISYIQLNGFQWTSGANPGGYLYGNALIPLTAGNNYTLRLGGSGQINNGNKYNVAVYLDANQNYIYEPGERVYGVGLINNTNVRNYSITVPATAATGITRIRVVLLKQNQGNITPCPAAGLLGEVEDYTVNITPPAASKTHLSRENELAKNTVKMSADSTQFEAKCKEFVTVYTSPFSCVYDLKVSDIDDESFGYDSIYLSGYTRIHQPGIPFTAILKVSKDNEGKKCLSQVLLRDTIPPVPVSIQKLIMTFFTTDSIDFTAGVCDLGSYDQCTPVNITFKPSYVRITDPSPLMVYMVVTDTFGNANSSLIEVEIVDKTQGIPAGSADGEKEDKILISPNPAVDFCLIKGENITSVRFLDAVGKMIFEVKNNINLNEIPLDIAGIRPGIYLVEIFMSDGKRYVKKVIKQ